jgi:hypothetical protein
MASPNLSPEQLKSLDTLTAKLQQDASFIDGIAKIIVPVITVTPQITPIVAGAQVQSPELHAAATNVLSGKATVNDLLQIRKGFGK